MIERNATRSKLSSERHGAAPALHAVPPALRLGEPVNFFTQRLQPIHFAAETRPMLQVIVDAEEEFDWSQPFDHRNDTVENIAHQVLAQRIFERYGIKPTYVVDYAVASQEKGFAPLRALMQGGGADIGAHHAAGRFQPAIRILHLLPDHAATQHQTAQHPGEAALREQRFLFHEQDCRRRRDGHCPVGCLTVGGGMR